MSASRPHSRGNPDQSSRRTSCPENYGMLNMFADVGTDHRMFSRLSPHRFAYLLGFIFPFFDKHRREMIMGSPEEKTTK